jgi:hypothetical protein
LTFCNARLRSMRHVRRQGDSLLATHNSESTLPKLSA